MPYISSKLQFIFEHLVIIIISHPLDHNMAKGTRLSADVTLRMANQFEATDDSKNDTIRSFGDTLKLDKLIIKKATTLGRKSSTLEGATQHLLNEWVNEHGSNDEAAKRLKTILTKNGYSKMADVIKEGWYMRGMHSRNIMFLF